jgi:hypothetical protein
MNHGDRHPEPPWTSLTRERSLVQIQYVPRSFSKFCLVAGTVSEPATSGFGSFWGRYGLRILGTE